MSLSFTSLLALWSWEDCITSQILSNFSSRVEIIVQTTQGYREDRRDMPYKRTCFMPGTYTRCSINASPSSTLHGMNGHRLKTQRCSSSLIPYLYNPCWSKQIIYHLPGGSSVFSYSILKLCSDWFFLNMSFLPLLSAEILFSLQGSSQLSPPPWSIFLMCQPDVNSPCLKGTFSVSPVALHGSVSPYFVYLSLLKVCWCLQSRTRDLSSFVSPKALVQTPLSVFTELTSKFSGGALFNIFLDPFLILLQHYEDRMIKSVSREYSILGSPSLSKKGSNGFWMQNT